MKMMINREEEEEEEEEDEDEKLGIDGEDI